MDTSLNIFIKNNDYKEFEDYIKKAGHTNILLVCDAIKFFKIGKAIEDFAKRENLNVILFDDFKPNPLYESVEKGVDILHENNCTLILAVGGGSAMDVAKCIKLYSNMDKSINYLKQAIVPNDIELMAVPTTAGTGSEATRFAVIYYNGEKQSVAHESAIPKCVVFDTSSLETLPLYQKKATMLDALCHAIESMWSVNSTDESKEYAKKAIDIIINNKDKYLSQDKSVNALMFEAANYAGKAINITQTTAGHAMSYKLTSLYNVAHGHAAALCLRKLFPYMINHMEKCIDKRGTEYLAGSYKQIASAMGCKDVSESAIKFDELFKSLELDIPTAKEEDYEILKNSVNVTRLKNNPIELDVDTIDMLYHQVLAK
ncbi:MAG: phosphonoacetaldehyde reductase [Lachnospiraceae bacterium]|nr:phosphonoacetaldehyde reductase [Lachnospiraceae bacterium]